MRIEDLTIVAWVGEDELGSGKIGLKQGHVPAGFIPLVAMDYDLEKIGRTRASYSTRGAGRNLGKEDPAGEVPLRSRSEETEYGA